MKVFFDTNVLLDLLLDREPFSEQAAALLSLVESEKLTGAICATTVTTIHYLVSKYRDKKVAQSAVETVMVLFEIAPVDKSVLSGAVSLGFSDYEDAVLVQSAVKISADYIVSRNIKDFKESPLPTYLPVEFLALLSSISTK